MADETNHSPKPEEQVNEIIADYLHALDAGRAPSRQELLDRHPECAAELRAFFADHDHLDQLAAPWPPPGTKVRYFGDYELLEEIARGGMGVVYKARQLSLQRVVALKMILAGQLAGESEVQRFLREAQTAANLQHPNIVAIHEVGQHEGQYYFSMDYVEGRSLAELVRDHPLPPAQAVRYVQIVAGAIQFAHRQGTLHRDLKPANILIDKADVPRVTDFGLARPLDKDTGLTASGAVVGTPSYMPPEQASAASGQLGPASDVYSLGAVLYELVTGRPPFRAATQLDTLLQVLEAEPAAPRLLNPGLSRDLETVILKCLAKEPGKRYASAQDLAEDLQAVREGRPVKARRPSLPERLGSWVKQQGRTFKISIAAAGVAILVLLAVLLILDWRREALLGEVEFETDGPALLAEVFTEDGTRLAVPPFTAPTRQPLRLPEGNYRMRLSAPYRLSETFQMLVRRGPPAEKYHIDLSERLLGEPLPSWGVFEFVRRGHGHDVLTVINWDTLRRYDGATGKVQWTVKLGPDDKPLPPGARPKDGEKPSWFFRPELNINVGDSGTRGGGESAPRLLRPCRDLDGDHVPDLVWASTRGSDLLAMSGKDGKFLWHFRPAAWLPPRARPGSLP
jgi:serine/threonine protein kinase